MRNYIRAALAGLVLSTIPIGAASASNCYYAPAGGTQCYPTMVVVDPTTGNPVNPAGGGGGGGGGATGSVTAAGTNGTLAQAIQGINGGVPVAVTGTFSATVSATYNSVPPTLTNGQSAPLQADTNGNLKTVIVGTPAINNAQVNGVAVATGAGVSNPGTQRIVTSTDSTIAIPDVRTLNQTLSAAANSTLIIPVNAAGTLGLSFSGLTASGATISFSASNDAGTTYTTVGSFNAATGVPSSTYAADGQTRIDVGARTNVKLTVTTGGTGTITVSSTASPAASLTANTAPIAPGANTIGKVGIDQTTPGTTNKVSIGADGSVAISGTPSINNAQVNGVAVATGTGTSNSGTQRVAVSSDSTITVASPVPATIAVGQAVISTTGTAVQLTANVLVNGIVIKAKASNNAACAAIGGSTVTNAYNGSGNGYGVCPGEAASFAVNNTNVIYVNGTAGDVFTFEGN